MTSGRPLPGSSARPDTPPGLDELQMPDPPARGPESARRLLEILESRPGGTQKLEEARRRGARIGALDSPPPAQERSWLQWLDPFKVKDAWAAQASFSVTVTPSNPSTSGATLYSLGAYNGPSYMFVYANYNWSRFPTSVAGAWARVGVNIPADGWYVVNLYGYFCSSIDVQLWASSSGPVLETWDFGDLSSCGAYDNPVLLELGQGWHSLYFVASGLGSFRLYEVSIFDIGV